MAAVLLVYAQSCHYVRVYAELSNGNTCRYLMLVSEFALFHSLRFVGARAQNYSFHIQENLVFKNM